MFAAWRKQNGCIAACVEMRVVPNNFSARAAGASPLVCGSPMQIVAQALHYFGQHFGDPIAITELAQLLGISEDCLDFSFDQVRGMTPAQALQEHRLNKLFTVLTDQPRQGLGRAIRSCGLGQTSGVVALFEQTFGIDMPLFLLTCRRAADDRLFRRLHPEPQALVLPQ
jgi:transcriptional regulator GlxA family with amidase domain